MISSDNDTEQADVIFSGYGLSGRAYLEALFFNTGFLLTIFLATLSLTVSLSFVLGSTISPLHVPFSAIFTIALGFYIGKNERIHKSQILLTLTLVFVIAILATTVSSIFYDTSYDGQAIHLEAILQLYGGWNPHYEYLDNGTHHATWITHYAKGSWLQGAAIYDFTGLIESGKSTNIVLIVISWLFASSLLVKIEGLSIRTSLIIATITALNPVSVYQALTFYIDGQLSSLFISLLALLIKLLQRPGKYILVASAALAMLLINIKFTGLVYAVILLSAFGCAFLYLNGWASTFRSASIPAAGVLLGIFLIGFNPYITNTVDRGHPFYPLMGEGTIDIVSPGKPKPLQSMNRLEALATSIFSVSSNSRDNYILKLPFKIPSQEEIGVFSGNEMRLGGWGPWFGFIFILAVPLAVAAFVVCREHTTRLMLAFLLTVLAVTVLANPEPWWARYTPQLFIMPLVVYTIYFSCSSGNLKIFVLVVIMTANLAMVLFPQAMGNLKGTIRLNRQLSSLSEQEAPLTVYFSKFYADRVRLDEAGINYSTVFSEDKLPCDNPETLVGSFWAVKICAQQ